MIKDELFKKKSDKVEIFFHLIHRDTMDDTFTDQTLTHKADWFYKIKATLVDKNKDLSSDKCSIGYEQETMEAVFKVLEEIEKAVPGINPNQVEHD